MPVTSDSEILNKIETAASIWSVQAQYYVNNSFCSAQLQNSTI